MKILSQECHVVKDLVPQRATFNDGPKSNGREKNETKKKRTFPNVSVATLRRKNGLICWLVRFHSNILWMRHWNGKLKKKKRKKVAEVQGRIVFLLPKKGSRQTVRPFFFEMPILSTCLFWWSKGNLGENVSSFFFCHDICGMGSVTEKWISSFRFCLFVCFFFAKRFRCRCCASWAKPRTSKTSCASSTTPRWSSATAAAPVPSSTSSARGRTKVSSTETKKKRKINSIVFENDEKDESLGLLNRLNRVLLNEENWL